MVVVAMTAVAAWWLLRPAPPTAEVVLPTLPPEVSVAVTSLVDLPILVHVTGAVVAPGVVEVQGNARVQDAVAAAGGPLGRADLDALNLAAPVSDGAQIHVPAVGEIAQAPLGSPLVGGPTPRVDLNTANAAALDVLPGIGPSTAAAIVKRRAEIGRFVTVDDLLEVPGIGPAKVDALRDLVVVS
ncbi:MAG: hypothetical protein RL391_187 [Actinomycetota bacterium]|jgi:competence protein ComEA